jgi:hypothetical protein
MGETTGGAAAKRKPDHRLANGAEADLVSVFSAILTAPDQDIQHCTLQGVDLGRKSPARLG